MREFYTFPKNKKTKSGAMYHVIWVIRAEFPPMRMIYLGWAK